MSEIERLRPDGIPDNAAYTPVVTARGTRTVYVSGQVAMDAERNLVGAGDLAAQTEQVMINLETALAAAGASFDDVVKIVAYVVDYQPEHLSILGEAFDSHLPPGKPPAITLVGIAALAAPEFLIEIEIIAVTD